MTVFGSRQERVGVNKQIVTSWGPSIHFVNNNNDRQDPREYNLADSSAPLPSRRFAADLVREELLSLGSHQWRKWMYRLATLNVSPYLWLWLTAGL
jgi:hypothetical protein